VFLPCTDLKNRSMKKAFLTAITIAVASWQLFSQTQGLQLSAQTFSKSGVYGFYSPRTTSRDIGGIQCQGFSLNARLQLSENSQAMIGLGLNDRNFIITSPLSQYWLYGSATHELRYFSRFRYRELLIPLAYRKHVKSGQWDVYNKVLLLSSLAFEGFYKSEPLSRELTTIEQRIWSSSLMISTQLERSIGNSLLIRFEPYASLARVRQDDKVVSFLDNNALSSLDEFGIKVSLDLTLATFSFKDKKSAEFID